MKTDKWFYELFLSQPGMLAELVAGIEADWEFTYSAPVIKEKSFELDGVFTPVLADPIVPLVLVEAQMQTDAYFYHRYFAEVFLYLKQYQIDRSWRGLLILRSRGQNFGSELPYNDLLDQRVIRLYLSDLKTQQNLTPNVALLQLLVLNQDRSVELSKTLLQAAPTNAEFQRRLSLIETILANKFPDLTTEMIMQILDLKQMDITQSRFYQEIRAEALQEGHQEGRQAGHQEGRQEGRQEEAANLVLRLLNRRFGTLSSEQIDRLRALSVPQLEELAEALLDFTALADLEVWLARQ
jgi:predicted transposase/invertase (TIGR01784 family)